MKSLSKLILNILGWKVVGNTAIPRKCIICVAPHTSNFDFPLGLMVYSSLGKKASFLIKKDWFFFPMNIIFKWLGGMPVDRSKKTSLTEQVVQTLTEKNDFQLAITPEGTRKRNDHWKKGFYYMALEAKVSIVVVALDYGKKEADFKAILTPSGDVEKDMDKITSCYVGVTAKHPENFALNVNKQ